MYSIIHTVSRLGVRFGIALTIAMFVYPYHTAESQVSRKRAEFLDQQEKAKHQQKFPDQYSDLDANKTGKAFTDDLIQSTLDASRQTYLQALILIKRGDTLSAARYFQQAIDNLNKLVGYPNIEQNEDFTDLAQSIVEDYESYITSLDFLDENASLFIIRDKLFQDIEKMPAAPRPTAATVAKQSKVAYPNKHTEPDKIVVPLVDHELVDRNVTFLTKNKRGIQFVKQCLERTGKYFPMMKRIAENEGMPEEIVYLSLIESGLDPIIVSSASAVGLWQFMRATGQDYKLNDKESFWLDERRDPEKATRAAMKHLRDLYYEFGDWHLSMAAYNCGTGCIRRALRKSGKEKASYWDIMKYLVRETANYVPSYIATARVIMNPEQYGIDINDIKFLPEYKYDLFQVNEPTNLTAIAKAAGTSVEEIKALNPELLQSITPADRKSYYVKIPFNTLNTFATNFNSLTPEEKKPFVFHTVDKNESLKQIAKKYNVSANDLVDINGLSGYKAKIKRGDQLRIPVGNAIADDLASKSVEPEPTVDTSSKANTPSKPVDSNVGQIVTHTVQRGESIYSIANRYAIRAIDIRNLNNLSFDDDNIQVGQKLIIAKNRVTEADYASAAPSKPTNIKHKVMNGETLSEIADDYGTTVDEIIKLNNIKRNRIRRGQILKINSNIEPESKSVASKSSSTKATKDAIHLVQRGETIGEIAKKYNISENQLIDWNKDEINGSIIVIGSRLKVQSDGSSSVSTKTRSKGKTNTVYYKVKSGDTLGSIAQKYGVSVSDIKKNNRNISETRLQIGENLRIK